MKKSSSIFKLFQELIVKHWFLLHLVFIAFYVLYSLYKISFSKNINPLSLDPDIHFSFNILYFGFLCTGFFILLIPVLCRKLKNTWIFAIAFASYLLISFGYISTKDKELKWFGSDVAWGNYNAAMEFKESGILHGIKTWNERTNPYIENKENNISDSVKAVISKYNLSWIAFDKWENTDFPEGYDPRNNRPHMHPPLAPILLALWLAIFPFGHWSSEILMILLGFVSILLAFKLTGYQFKNGNKELIVLLALLTTPVMILFHNPSGEQLSMLLFVMSVLMIYDTAKAKAGHYFISGILIGLTFFTKFNIVFYIVLQVIVFVVHHNMVKWKCIILYFSGIITIVAVFTLLGYYFWLTIITGFVYSKLYALYNQVSILQGFSKLLYYGITIILLILLLISDFKKYVNKIILIPVLLSLILLMVYLWDQGTLNRYLVFYLPVLGLFFVNMKSLDNIKTRDIVIVPITNLIFISINTYF